MLCMHTKMIHKYTTVTTDFESSIQQPHWSSQVFRSPPPLLKINNLSKRRIIIYQATDKKIPKNHLSVADNVFGVCIAGHFKLEATDEVVGAQCPEVRLLNVQHTL